MELVYNEKFNAWVRPGTLDEYVLKEIKGAYSFLNVKKGDVVVDIGANIGAFSKYAIENNAAKVYSFEPEPENFSLLQTNSPKSKNYNYAVVGGDQKTIDLYVNGKKNKGLHMTRPVRGRDKVTVKTINFNKIIKKYKPNKVKIDIEGGEYDILPYKFPEYVERIAIEIHFLYDKTRHAKGKKIHENLLAQGFISCRDTKFDKKLWTTLGWYKRENK